MKPSKKHLNKKRKNDDTSTPEIKCFFKAAPQSFVAKEKPKNNSEEPSSRDFYIQTLKEIIHEENHGNREGEAPDHLNVENALEEHRTEDLGREDGACAVVLDNTAEPVPCPECELNRKERKEWEDKYKELKKTYYKLAVHYSELELKHKDLTKVASARANENCIDVNAISVAADGDIFTANELRFLQSMSLDKHKDSTFVLHCMKFAYKQEMSVLNNKSLFGTKGRIEFTDDGKEVHQPPKQPLSPNKVDRIKGMFIERISKCEIKAVEHAVRIKETYLNQLFASAINNICKKRD